MKRLHVFLPEQQIEGLAVLSKKTGSDIQVRLASKRSEFAKLFGALLK
jgi:hypothetical protein